MSIAQISSDDVLEIHEDSVGDAITESNRFHHENPSIGNGCPKNDGKGVDNSRNVECDASQDGSDQCDTLIANPDQTDSLDREVADDTANSPSLSQEEEGMVTINGRPSPKKVDVSQHASKNAQQASKCRTGTNGGDLRSKLQPSSSSRRNKKNGGKKQKNKKRSNGKKRNKKKNYPPPPTSESPVLSDLPQQTGPVAIVGGEDRPPTREGNQDGSQLGLTPQDRVERELHRDTESEPCAEVVLKSRHESPTTYTGIPTSLVPGDEFHTKEDNIHGWPEAPLRATPLPPENRSVCDLAQRIEAGWYKHHTDQVTTSPLLNCIFQPQTEATPEDFRLLWNNVRLFPWAANHGHQGQRQLEPVEISLHKDETLVTLFSKAF